MADSTAMTIDFLRARLLSERSVSRAARERADQLAKRVVELEEQLRIVTFQRKKAEKAATEVLAILDSQGFVDLSEAVDSSSDQDEDSGGVTKSCGGASNGDEISNGSKMETSEAEDALSAADVGDSSRARGLSWKSRSETPDDDGKQRARHFRQRHRRSCYSYASETSPKYQVGKSCRKIKRKDLRLAACDEGNDHKLQDGCLEGEIRSDCTDDQPDSFIGVSKSEACSLEQQNRDTDSGSQAMEDGKEEEMERVLEEQAQLIGQYEEEEKAQREWEKKYNENNSSTRGNCDVGKQLHLVESNCKQEEEAIELVDENLQHNEEAKSSCKNLTSSNNPTGERLATSSAVASPKSTIHEEAVGRWEEARAALFAGFKAADVTSTPAASYLLDQNHDEMPMTEVGFVLGASTMLSKGNLDGSPVALHGQIQPPYEISESGCSCNLNVCLCTRDCVNVPSNESPSTDNSDYQNHENNRLEIQLYQAPSSKVGGVLEALERAKLSLREKLSKLPLQDTVASTTGGDSYYSRAGVPIDAMRIPVGSAGLFRIPTEQFSKPHLSAGKVQYHAYSKDAMSGHGSAISIVGTEAQLPTRQFVDPYSSLMRVPFSSGGHGLTFSEFTTERVSFPSQFAKHEADFRKGLPVGERFSFSLYGRESALSDL